MKLWNPFLLMLGVCLTVSMASMTWADERLDTGKALWQTSGISTYQYRYQKICECHRSKPSETIVSVDMGTIVGVRYDREDYLKEILVPTDRHKWFRTIGELFELVDKAYQLQAQVRVSYEPQLGYPQYIYIDYDEDLVGEEVELRILELNRLN